MLKIGDVVVTMSYPGLFTVLEIDGETLTLGAADGGKILVSESNVRRLDRDS